MDCLCCIEANSGISVDSLARLVDSLKLITKEQGETAHTFLAFMPSGVSILMWAIGLSIAVITALIVWRFIDDRGLKEKYKEISADLITKKAELGKMSSDLSDLSNTVNDLMRQVPLIKADLNQGKVMYHLAMARTFQHDRYSYALTEYFNALQMCSVGDNSLLAYDIFEGLHELISDYSTKEFFGFDKEKLESSIEHFERMTDRITDLFSLPFFTAYSGELSEHIERFLTARLVQLEQGRQILSEFN